MHSARELVRVEPPAVLLTDLKLPDGRGDDLAREMISDHVDLVTIGMTGSDVECMDNEVFDHILQKPMHFDELAGVLSRLSRP
jgi:DNA-binding NtrC family response regulator